MKPDENAPRIYIPSRSNPGAALGIGDPFSESATQTDPPRTVHPVGYKSDIDQNQAEEVCSKLDGAYVFPAVAAVVDITTTNAQDGPGGTGIRTLWVEGTDSTGAWQGEIVTTPAIAGLVQTENEYLRINAIYGLTCGTDGGANAAINIAHPAGTGAGAIAIGTGALQNCIYTVPLNYKLIVTEWAAQLRFVVIAQATSTSLLVTLRARRSGGPWIFKDAFMVSSMYLPYANQVLETPFVFPAQTDVVILASAATADQQQVAAGFGGYLVKTKV